jgi:hypothetical protein
MMTALIPTMIFLTALLALLTALLALRKAC